MNKYHVEVIDSHDELIEADSFEVHETGSVVMFWKADTKEFLLKLVATYPAHLVMVKEVLS